MPRTRLTEWKTVRHKRADGTATTYHYDRATGARMEGEPPPIPMGAKTRRRRTPIPDALAFQRVAIDPVDPGDATLGALVRAWRYSSHFADLSPKTQANYNCVSRHRAVAPLLAVPCRAVTPRSLRLLRDGIAEDGRARRGKPTKRMANLVLNVLGAAFAWGVENLDLEANPVMGLKRLKPDSGGHLPWSDDAVHAWLERAPEWARRVVHLGLWTALRAQDLISLRWDAWDGTAIHVTPSKTKKSSGVALYIPLSPEANATLAAWRAAPTVGVTILTQANGSPWRGTNYLALAMARLRDTLGLTGTTHGLRVTAATRLVEAGVAARDVMALTGHTQDATFAKYIRHADQRQRAERAAAAWAKVTPLRRHS
jgi:integrase